MGLEEGRFEWAEHEAGGRVDGEMSVPEDYLI